MNLFTCEHPKKVYNPYIQDYMIVPCGKCDTCKMLRASSWVERLESERACHKYALFFTLTYSDDFVPRFEVFANTDTGDYDLVDVSDGETHSFDELGLNSPNLSISRDYLLRREWVCHSRPKDIQNFIKRLRSKVNYYESVELHKRVRYYVAQEYGPTTHRIHYHGILFFESEWLASRAKEVVSEAWSTDNRDSYGVSLGRIDVSFIESSAASYVAQYVNCFNRLPKIYLCSLFRPRSFFSRCPAIGTLQPNDGEIQKLYDSSTSRIRVFSRTLSSYVYVPFSQSFEDRLYPKIKYFSTFSHTDRTRLYLYLRNTRYPVYDFKSFQESLVNPVAYDAYPELKTYLMDFARPENESACHRFYCVLNRAENICYNFSFTMDQFVSKIEAYLDDKEKQGLVDQLKLAEDLRDSYDYMFIDLLYLDRLFYKTNFSYADKLFFKSFGYNSFSYQDLLMIDFTECESYKSVVSRSHKKVEQSTKFRIKNEYVQLCKDKRVLNLPNYG